MQYLKYKSTELWGKAYCCNLPVAGKELIPGAAINTLGKKPVDNSSEYSSQG